ncbi:MAG TPA: hypothetical protein VGJ73_14515 [Verrucomicrobiae bacterium]|jgi:hypothetical protein
MTTPAQIEANRRNAQHSTGPKTPEGKAASSQNAVKYGMLARQLIVQGEYIQESPEEFQSLWTEHHDQLAPVGPLEEMLVDQIVALNWRMRRVHAAESGAITLHMDTGCRHRARVQAQVGETEEWPHLDSYIEKDLLELREKIEQGDEFTKMAIAKIADDTDGYYPALLRKLNALHAHISQNLGNLDPVTLHQNNRQKILATLDEEIKKLSEQQIARRKHEVYKEQAYRNADSLPGMEVVQKILRVETVLERQLFRAIQQLEHLQTRRLANNASPVSVSLGHAAP